MLFYRQEEEPNLIKLLGCLLLISVSLLWLIPILNTHCYCCSRSGCYWNVYSKHSDSYSIHNQFVWAVMMAVTFNSLKTDSMLLTPGPRRSKPKLKIMSRHESLDIINCTKINISVKFLREVPFTVVAA